MSNKAKKRALAAEVEARRRQEVADAHDQARREYEDKERRLRKGTPSSTSTGEQEEFGSPGTSASGSNTIDQSTATNSPEVFSSDFAPRLEVGFSVAGESKNNDASTPALSTSQKKRLMAQQSKTQNLRSPRPRQLPRAEEREQEKVGMEEPRASRRS